MAKSKCMAKGGAVMGKVKTGSGKKSGVTRGDGVVIKGHTKGVFR